MDLFKLVALTLAIGHDGKSILDLYPTTTNLSPPDRPITYVEALWDAIISEDKEPLHTPERTSDTLGVLLSIFKDEKMPTCLRESLEESKTAISAMKDVERVVDRGSDDLFLKDYDWMERQVWRGDLVITEAGGFGITNGLEVAAEGMVVAIVGGADEVYLLRECGGGGNADGGRCTRR